MLPTIVLAAGLGTRLQPLTRHLAKPAVPVAGKALIVRVLEWLSREGVRDAIVNLHHLPGTVTGIVGDGTQLGLRVRYSWEREILGSAGGPRLALSLWPELQGPCLITNGDTLTDFPLAPLLAAHAASRADGGVVTMAVVRNVRPDHYNGLRLDEDGRVLAFVPRGHTEETWHFVGVQVVEPGVFDGIPLGSAAETVAGVYRDLVRDRPGAVRAWRVDATFLDVGTPSDYIDASLHIAAQEGRAGDVIIETPWTADARPGTVDPTARLTSCVVWPDATVGADAVLDRCVVLSGVTVPAGTQAVGKVFD
ncbi:MAG: NTP transferase domain-containing protein [Acidobacteria bacterium]|nr:NTP transferase domain-containing protein [Acidobacteriota bacterium]